MARWRRAASRLAPAVCAALLLVSMLFLSRLARAAERVGVDAGLHPGYARIVFDWPAKVGFEAKIEGETLRVHFTRPLNADLAVVARRIDTYVATIAMAGETDVVATLRRPVELHSFTLGDKVAIDLVEKPVPSKLPPPRPAPVEAKRHSETKSTATA